MSDRRRSRRREARGRRGRRAGVASSASAVALGTRRATRRRCAPPRRAPRRRPSSAATSSTATRSQGTLGYADASRCSPARAGTITRLREPGAVVRRGQSLYDVDDAPAAWLLYGALPAWRDFTPGMSDGEDVRQLERNLRALGYDPDHDMTIDDDWTWATTAAVERFQDDRGLTEDGTLTRGEVVFRPGPRAIGESHADGRPDGRARRAGSRELTSTRRRDHGRPRRPTARSSRTRATT